MIDKHKARLFRVRRPDGAIVDLTCTLAQFEEHWKPQGYAMKTDLAQFEEPEEVEAVEKPVDDKAEKPAQGRRRNRARGNSANLPAQPLED